MRLWHVFCLIVSCTTFILFFAVESLLPHFHWFNSLLFKVILAGKHTLTASPADTPVLDTVLLSLLWLSTVYTARCPSWADSPPLCLNSSLFACTSAASQFTCSPAGRVFSRCLHPHSRSHSRPFLMPVLWWLCSLPKQWRIPHSLPSFHPSSLLPPSLCLSLEAAGCGFTLHTASWDPKKKYCSDAMCLRALKCYFYGFVFRAAKQLKISQ